MLLLIDCKDRMLQKEVAVPPASPPQSAATYIDYGDVGMFTSSAPLKTHTHTHIHTRARTHIHTHTHTLSSSCVFAAGYAAMGTVGKVLVDLAIIISQVGFCCAYLIFISENLNSIFPGIST